MQAIVGTKYGSADVLELREIERPEVGDDGVLVRVRAVSLNPYDWHLMHGIPYVVRLTEGLRRPKSSIRGVDMAGQVEAVGKDVTRFRPGDEVFGWGRSGALAEYERALERTCVPKPRGLSFEQAATIPMAGCTALQALRDKGGLEAGQRVLVNGASGGVGTFAVQIAKEIGAEVTGVCSTANVELVRSLGADRVVDYTTEDFSRGDERYDLVLDLVGNRSLSELRRRLAPAGTLVLAGGTDGNWLGPFVRPLGALVLTRLAGQRLVPFLARLRKDDLTTLADLVEAGKLTPVVDRTYPLDEAPAGIRYLEGGHARGKVVVTI